MSQVNTAKTTTTRTVKRVPPKTNPNYVPGWGIAVLVLLCLIIVGLVIGLAIIGINTAPTSTAS